MVIEKLSVSGSLLDEVLIGIEIGKNGEIFFELKDGAAFIDADGKTVLIEVCSIASISSSGSVTGFHSNGKTDIFFDDKWFQELQTKNDLAGFQPLLVSDFENTVNTKDKLDADKKAIAFYSAIK